MKIKQLRFMAGWVCTFLLVPAALIAVTPNTAEAFAISPPVITAPAVMKNISQTKTVTLSRSVGDPEGEIFFNVIASGETAAYLDFPETFSIPEGVERAVFSIDIVPTDLANGDYESIVTFEGLAPESEDGSSSVGIIQAIGAYVRFTVSGEEVVDYSIDNMNVSDSETDQVHYVVLTLSNAGNVQWRPEKVLFRFTDTEDESNVVEAIVEKEGLAFLDPGLLREEVRIGVDADLIQGSYDISADVYDAEGVVTTVSARSFNVFAPGTLSQSGELISLETNKTSYKKGDKIKLDAVFANTGEGSATVKLMTEIYLGEDYIDVMRGDELVVGFGEEVTLSEIIELDEDGEYTLSSYVFYGNQKTATKEVVVAVGNATSSSGASAVDEEGGADAAGSLPIIPIIIGLLVLIILIVVVILVMKKKGGNAPAPGGDFSQTNNFEENSAQEEIGGGDGDSGAIEF